MIDFLTSTPWVRQVAFVLGGVLLGLLTERFLVRALHTIAKRTESTWDDLVIQAIHRMPLVWWTAAGVWGAVLARGIDPNLQAVVGRTLVVVMIGSVTIVGMRLASGAVDRYAARSARIPSTTLLTNLARLVIGILGLFLILQNLRIEITPLLTAMGIGGLAVALALQDTLSNLFAGISIILSGQVRPDDYVQLASGEQGFVTDVKARNSTIRTFPTENLVVVPNSVLASSIVTNYSLPKRSLTIAVPVGVSYDSDLEEVERVAIEVAVEALEAAEGKAPETPPWVRYREFGDSSINFDVLLSADGFRSQSLIQHEFIKRLHARFNAEGIEIPFPIRTLHMPGADLSGPDGLSSEAHSDPPE